jgi:predicted RND superfamily exporter protein
MRSTASGPPASVRRFVEWTLRRGRLIWVVALVLGIPAALRTAYLYAHLRSEVEQLLPREAPSVRALDELRERSPGLHFLGVVVEVPDVERLPDAERFVDDLAARIRTYPPEMVRDVRSSNADQRDFVEHHGAVYTDLADLQEIRRRLEARRDYEVSKEQGQLLDEDAEPPSTDISDIQKKYENRVGGEKGDHLSSQELRAAMIVVEAGGLTTGAESDRRLLDRVKADVAVLGPTAYAPGARVGYASDVAINVEELDALESDLSVSSILVVVAVMAVIVIYYQWWRAVPVLIPPLLLALVYAFAAASLPPLNVTELNSNTAFLGSIIVGNGINVGLILLARYREERMRGASVEEALVVAVWGARVGTLAAAAAAGASYASLVVTEFRGFRQFGVIGGIGMLASWATAFVLVPPLLKWLDREGAISGRTATHHGLLMRWVLRVVERWSPVVVALAVAGAVASIVQVTHFDSSRIEHDISKLRRADTWTTGEGFWGRKANTILGRYPTPTVVLLDTPEQARAVEKLVRASTDDGELQPLVARVVGADDVVPTDQAAKIDEARAIRDELTPKIRSLVVPDKLAKLDKMLTEDGLRPIAAADVPPSLTTGLRERDGTLGRTVLVYPRPSEQLWRADTMRDFVSTLRDFAARGAKPGERAGRVAGSLPLSSDIFTSIERDAPIASAVSLLGVVIVVVVVLRARRASIHVVAALVLGVLWLAGAVMYLGIKINFCNFIAFPITFGIGVDYAVNVMTRYVQDGERDITGAVRSTGGAVTLCSLTTIIGYSSLLLAKNQALYLFGLVAVLGEIACLTAAVISLPAWLVFARRLKPAPQPSSGSTSSTSTPPVARG